MTTSDVPTPEQSLAERDRLAEQIKKDPYSIDLRVKCSRVYEVLGYPDLAVMDAYKALLLVDEVLDDSGEYHELALSSLRDYLGCQKAHTDTLHKHSGADLSDSFQALDMNDSQQSKAFDDEECARYVDRTWRKDIILSLCKNLTEVGCFRAACEYAYQVLRTDPENVDAKEIIGTIRLQTQSKDESFDEGVQLNAASLSDRGRVRREVYPWNRHQTERHTKEVLDLLNHEMRYVAPKLEIRITELPSLSSDDGQGWLPGSITAKTIRQLGVFAKEDILPGEEVLRERSLLTGSSRLHDPLCDACSSQLPSLDEVIGSDKSNTDDSKSLVPCADCDDVVFCSQVCHDMAQAQYHPAVCGLDADAIAKDVPPQKAADSLYALLLFRSLCMAITQSVHPLDLKEVQFIWGDFALPPASEGKRGADLFLSAPRTLPFSFDDNIVTPLLKLEMMEMNIFDDPNDLGEAWVWNTLYAKFRATASARISTRDGRPEVAAVHPFWCLANHSCDPNVQWEWAGEIQFTAREERIAWSREAGESAEPERRPGREGGIKKDEEILNHYVDIELPVQGRREWGVGALGGFCMCSRCLWESSTGKE